MPEYLRVAPAGMSVRGKTQPIRCGRHAQEATRNEQCRYPATRHAVVGLADSGMEVGGDWATDLDESANAVREQQGGFLMARPCSPVPAGVREQVLMLRNECGLSLRQAAHEMNRLGVPPPSGKGIWWAQTISRVCVREHPDGV